MTKKVPQFQLTDHLCRFCGGRILEEMNHGPTGGGKPVWRCADCGARNSALTPAILCWCGAEWRNGDSMNMQCVAIADAHDDPLLVEALAQCGCGSAGYKYEVGVINTLSYLRLKRESGQ